MLKWALFMWQRTAASVSDLFTICNLFLFVINRGMYSAEIHWNYLLSHLFLSAKMTKYLFFFFVFKGFEIKDWVLKTQWQWQYILTTLSDIHHHLISLWQPDSTYLFVLNVSRCMDVLQRRVRWTLFFCPLLYPYSLSPDRLLILWKKKACQYTSFKNIFTARCKKTLWHLCLLQFCCISRMLREKICLIC